jgi:hypothetical protein
MMVQKEQVICFSEGEYSDYGLMGHFKVLKRFDPKVQLTKYLDSDPGVRDIFEYFDRSSNPIRRLPEPVKVGTYPVEHSSDGFQAYLIRNGYVEDFNVTEIHLGSYGRLSIS